MKKDKYLNFRHLADHEVEGIGYRVRSRSSGATLVLAPHGGGIEPGTSELAAAIAAQDHPLYIFEGLKAVGNGDLHITSSNFDEPACRRMVARAERVITIHGEERDAPVVFIGGLDQVGVERLSTALVAAGFAVKAPDKDHLKGQAQANICNRGRTGAGVQLEITEGLRRIFFQALTPRVKRQHTTSELSRFVAAVRKALSNEAAL